MNPAISDDLFQHALNILIESGEFQTYESVNGSIVTSKRLLELETNIANFVKYKDDECCDRDYEDLFQYEYDSYDYDEFGNFTESQLHVFIRDAERHCLDPKMDLTNEQRTCIVMILQERFSMVNAPGGTGKTNAVLKPVIHIMKKLGYSIMTVTPTHAAKKPICSSMNWNQKNVSTIASLTFDFGCGPKICEWLSSIKPKDSHHSYDDYNDYDDYDDYDGGFDEHYDEHYDCKDNLKMRKTRIFVAMDESSMYGSEDLGCLFGELFAYRKYCMTRTCMMGDTGQ